MTTARLITSAALVALAVFLFVGCSQQGNEPIGADALSRLSCESSARRFVCEGAGCRADEGDAGNAGTRAVCEDGEIAFEDECGCGCLAASCQPGNRDYFSTSPDLCHDGVWSCDPTDQKSFRDACGCGCINLTVPTQACDLPNRVFLCIGPDCCPGALLTRRAAPFASAFVDGCGCGWDAPALAEPWCHQPNRRYTSRTPGCPLTEFDCGEGEILFDDACGCGCLSESNSIVSCESTRREYQNDDPTECGAVACGGGEIRRSFYDGCGCGCESPSLE